MTDPASALGPVYYPPEDFEPDERCKGIADEFKIDLELAVAEFVSMSFPRPRRWHHAFYAWLLRRKVWDSTRRHEDRLRGASGPRRDPGPTWEPNAKHKAFCAAKRLPFPELVARYKRSGGADKRSVEDTHKDFGARLMKVARGEQDVFLGEGR